MLRGLDTHLRGCDNRGSFPRRRESRELDTRLHECDIAKGHFCAGGTCGSNITNASKRMGQYYVYILASQRNGTLYIGMTNDLIRRVWEHKQDLVEGFTKKYGVHRLVWYEPADEPLAAITREKQLKKWNRAWKLRLIEEMNPDWRDLYEDIVS